MTSERSDVYRKTKIRNRYDPSRGRTDGCDYRSINM